MGKLIVDLFEPGMTMLHRAGVAGLYTSIKYFDEQNWNPPGLVNWSYDSEKVTLEWEGSAVPFFDALLKESFGVNSKTGMISITAIADKATPAAALVLHNGILGTFLQHGKTRSLEKNDRVLTFQNANDGENIIKYRQLDLKKSSLYNNRDKGKEFGIAVDKNKLFPISGWLIPGGAVRHQGFTKETQIYENVSRALALIFAPIGCFYYKVNFSQVLLIPDILNLVYFEELRSIGSDILVGDDVKASLGHVALDFMVKAASRNIAKEIDIPGVRAIFFGKIVPKSKQQQKLKIIEIDSKNSEALRIASRLQECLPSRTRIKNDQTLFVAQSSSLALFLDNIANNKPFLLGFANLFKNNDVRKYIGVDKFGFAKIVDKEMGIMSIDQVEFIEICHHALKVRYAKLAEGISDNSKDFKKELIYKRFEKEFDRLLRAFQKAATLKDFRVELSDFLAKGSCRNSLLSNKWKSVLLLLTENNWQEGRDLVVLALASYSKNNKEVGE